MIGGTAATPPSDIFRLGLVTDLLNVGAAGDALDVADDGALIETLRVNKVLRLAQIRLRRLAAHDMAGHRLQRVLDRLAAELEAPSRRLTTLEGTWEMIKRSAEGIGCQPLAFKGLAARAWYPRPEDRHLGDVDLWVPTVRHAFALATTLCGQGWKLNPDEPPQVGANGIGEPFGAVNLLPAGPSGLMVDVQFGDFSIGSRATVPIDPGAAVPAETKRRWRTGDADTVLTIVAAIAKQGWVSVKDVNDLFLCGRRTGVDWDRVRRGLWAAELTPIAAAAVQAVRHLYADREASAALWESAEGVSAADLPLGVPASGTSHETSTDQLRRG